MIFIIIRCYSSLSLSYHRPWLLSPHTFFVIVVLEGKYSFPSQFNFEVHAKFNERGTIFIHLKVLCLREASTRQNG